MMLLSNQPQTLATHQRILIRTIQEVVHLVEALELEKKMLIVWVISKCLAIEMKEVPSKH